MDVKKFLVFPLIVLLTACGDDDDSGAELPLRDTFGACRSQEIKGSYLVKWKNGNVQKVSAKDEKELNESWLKEHKDDIAYIQPDLKITLPEPVQEKQLSVQMAPINWQHEVIDSESAWNQNNYGQDIIVAVIDSGVDVNHPQLRDQILVNQNEIPGNGVDDDANGLVDDYLGYDFHYKTGNIGDSNGHGTHVAGIIAASHELESDPKGVAPLSKILALGFMSESGAGRTSDAIQAIYYAYRRGAKIINASWGSSQCDAALRDAIAEVTANGVLFVAAAGNQSLDLDIYQTFPTSFGLSGVVNVAASTDLELTASFSNYGRNSVELVAPGKDIYSTYRNGSYATLSGTSMAAPVVSGVAALALKSQPNLSVTELKAILMNTTKSGFYPVITTGQVNVPNLLQSLN